MVLKTAFLFFAAFALVALGRPAWADGEHGTTTESAQYAAREADSPSLQEFSGGIGGILAAIVTFFSNAVQAIVDLFCCDEPDPAAPTSAEQGRCGPTGLPDLT